MVIKLPDYENIYSKCKNCDEFLSLFNQEDLLSFLSYCTKTMEIYSPIHRVVYENITVDVKRDDLIDPYISGNKYRKLKYLLKKAASLDKRHLVTFGGAYSNHILATAAAAARFDFKSTAFVRGEAVENPILFLSGLFGMRTIFTDRTAYRDKQTLFNQYFGEDPEAFFIGEGGASAEAVNGCAEIIDEVCVQSPLAYDHIFCAAGTGTTAAGLLRGIRRCSLPTELHIVPVLKDSAFIYHEIIRNEKNDNGLCLHSDYHFGGYAKTTPELIRFIKAFTRKTGLLIDHVYTAKVFYALFSLIKEKKISKDARILVLHTGGLIGLLGLKLPTTLQGEDGSGINFPGEIMER